MNGFRFLAIRPLMDCSEKYSKILENGRLYQFYQDVKIGPELLKSNDDLISIERKLNISHELFNIKTTFGKKIAINISAIVGTNGSGKSTLLELLYATTFIIAEKEKLFKEEGIEFIKKEFIDAQEELEKFKKFPSQTENDWFESMFRNMEEILKNDENNETKYNLLQNSFDNSILKPEDLERKVQDLDLKYQEYESLYNELKLDLFFEINDCIYMLRVDSSNIQNVEVSLLDGDNPSFNKTDILKCFFYSIVINYSIYGLNDKVIGDWINPLFHKNDGYQTPIVINPMRENGDFNINREEYLAKSRLISNLLLKTKSNEHRKISDKQDVKFFLFTINEKKVKRIRIKRNEDRFLNTKYADNIVNTLIHAIYSKFNIKDNLLCNNNIPHQELLENYIIEKIEKILWTYDQYKLKYTNSFENVRSDVFVTLRRDKISELINELYLDNSHVTYKLKQAINFLKYSPLNNSQEDKGDKLFQNKNINIEKWSNTQFLISIERLSEIVKNNRDSENKNITEFNTNNQTENLIKDFELSYINFIPPSLFDIEILMSTENPDKYSSFSSLSSGEQQHIHSIQTILYHINNINSVFKQPKNKDSFKRIEYNAINIILDEIELYYHPDFQRRFIKDLLAGVRNLKIGYNKGVNSINILLATHSPFILSDIPFSNILRLKEGKPYNEKMTQTFGANIHDLLANDFFLDKGFMGEFAKEKIESVIKYLSKNENDFNWNDEKTFHFITSIIGEPLLREALLELYKTKKEKLDDYSDWIKKEYARLN